MNTIFMKWLIILSFCSVIFTLSEHNQSTIVKPIGRITNRGNRMSPLVGGYRSVLVSILPSDIDSFVKRSRPELRNGKVIRLQSQVVAGTNWKILYQVLSNRYQVIVFEQPWTKTIRVSSFKKI